MLRRTPLLGLGILLAGAAILFLALRRDGEAEGRLPGEPSPAPVERTPGLTAKAAAPSEPAAPAQAPTETAWLDAWDPADGMPMGDDTLRGVVVDPAGRPIFDARIYLRTKPGQPALLDAPSIWEARSDREGAWQIEMAYAARSILCAWAPGYERACVTDLLVGEELRVVLEPAPPLLVTVNAPPAGRFEGALEDARIRVRLVGEGGGEHPRPGEPLDAVWDQLVETGVPTPVRMPRDVRAMLTADAPGLACDPAFVALPVVAKEVVLQLVPSATIRLRLLDADTKELLPLGEGGWGFTRVVHVASGFEVENEWRGSTIVHGRGVTTGTYRLEARYRGYLPPEDLTPVEITKAGQVVDVDIPLHRDKTRATVHLVLRHAAGSQRASSRIQSGLTLVRRRQDTPPSWKHVRGMTLALSGNREERSFEDLTPGTYDVLVWAHLPFSPVGSLVAIEVEGGTETTHEVELREGYGFSPSDGLEEAWRWPRRLRAQSGVLGVLPWIVPAGDRSDFYMPDAEGFARVSTTGYIGMYPSPTITIVEQPQGAKAVEHVVKASISPPR